MVKKITKYLKFVVCCTLILSLIAPSYAALSASDGSAFVTKAEFDSALADFNARLTTFEAGINSKIDSQVTSYLDRNGIWNGAGQEWDIRNKYIAESKHWAVSSIDSWYTTRYVGSQFEQLNFNQHTDGAISVLERITKEKTITWANGEKSYTATYDWCPETSVVYPSYTRIYFFDDAFVAKKSGLCFYRIALSWGGPVRWYQPKYTKYNVNRAINANKDDWEAIYYDTVGAAPPQLICFWYVTADKTAEYGVRDESQLFVRANISPSWEFLPAFAIGTQLIDAGGVMTPLSGNFFVEKGKSYGCGIRPFYCWSSEDAPYFIEDEYKWFDTGNAAKIYFGPVTQWYARYVPQLDIY